MFEKRRLRFDGGLLNCRHENESCAQALSIFAFLLLATVIIAGCKTTPKTDWDGRIGTFTYDQAVVELGSPDKRFKLDNGQTVAEWTTHRGGNGVSVCTGFGVVASASGSANPSDQAGIKP